jgi:acetyl/propionyl-CoA carboxylase alpha subunit
VIEEAPAFINENTRSAMHAAAVRLASEANYFSVGTVEFLVDASSRDPLGPATFYFLEMNTRLQVEHTVTEQVFGVDLVALQLRIAMGAPLPEELKADLRPRGVSIQARIYAEKVADGFLPAPGMVHSFVPYAAPFMRWEVGIDAIDEVSMDFDPMVAKAIASGTTRIEAINRLALALKKSVYTGTESNIAFLIAVLEDQQFRDHNFDTHFIDKNLSRLIEVIASRKTALATSGSALFADARLFAGHVPARKLAQTDVGHLTRQIFSTKKPVSDGDHTGPRCVVCDEQTKHSRRHRYITSRIGRGLVDLNGDGQMHDMWFVETAVNGHPPERHLSIDGVTLKQERLQRPRYGAFTSEDRTATSAMAPVPGRVLGISVIKGAQVLKNDILLTIESMKMEFAVRAPCDLTVSEIKVVAGALVRADETLVVW